MNLGSAPLGGGVNQFSRNLGYRENRGKDPEASADARHSVDYTASFVLPNCEASGIVNGLHSLRSIRSHASHNHASCTASVHSGDRFHEDVNRGDIRGIHGAAFE